VYVVTKFKVELTLCVLSEGPNPLARTNIITETAKPRNPYAHPNPASKISDDELKEDKDEGPAALQKLFQGLYADADEDTKRAMMKSYQTSGGTVLSTNWGEVKDKDYDREIQAPNGQEVRRWH
jgi:suppressor of G2 allele of SKP1